MEDLSICIIVILSSFLMFATGAIYNAPTELENGCIVHNNKIYCEELNKVED